MSKNKNKPKKNAAAVEPVSQEAGTTEVIVGPGAVVPVPAAEAPAEVTADAPAEVTADATVPADAEPAATESPDAEKSADAPDIERLAGATATTSEVYKDFTGIATTATATEPAATASASATEPVSEPATTTPATTTQPAEATPAPKTGFLNYIRSFFVDIGGAIHR